MDFNTKTFLIHQHFVNRVLTHNLNDIAMLSIKCAPIKLLDNPLKYQTKKKIPYNTTLKSLEFYLLSSTRLVDIPPPPNLFKKLNINLLCLN